MTADFAARYGPWALIAGASDGVGAAFAEALGDGEPPQPGVSALIRIRPTRVLSWGLDSNAFAPPIARNVDGPRAP